MPGRNFENDSISFPYPNDREFTEAEVVHSEVTQVRTGGYTGVDSEWAGHFVAWVPLTVNGVLRTTTLHENPEKIKPTYVQSEGGINIGPKEKWGNEHVAIFVLEEQLDDAHKTATND